MPTAPLRALGLMLLCCSVAPAWAAHPLTVMVEDAAGPWSNPDGSGMANDLVKAAYAAAGQHVTPRCGALCALQGQRDQGPGGGLFEHVGRA
jgi:hypothetical protein